VRGNQPGYETPVRGNQPGYERLINVHVECVSDCVSFKYSTGRSPRSWAPLSFSLLAVCFSLLAVCFSVLQVMKNCVGSGNEARQAILGHVQLTGESGP